MKIELAESWKSIEKLSAPGELPPLVIITGPNGCGKSHLLEAIDTGKATAKLDGAELTTAYRSNHTLQPSSGSCDPEKLLRNQEHLWDAFSSVLQESRVLRQAEITNSCKAQGIDESVTSKFFAGEQIPRGQFKAIKAIEDADRAEWIGVHLQQIASAIESASQARTQRVGGQTQTVSPTADKVALANYLKSLSGKSSGTCIEGVEAIVALTESSTGKSIYEVSGLEFREGIPLSTERDPFSVILSEWFVDYHKRFWRFAQPRLEASSPPSINALKKKYVKQNGQFPWDEVNALLATAELDLAVASPSFEAGARFELEFQSPSFNGSFKGQNLSSGEKIIVALAPLVSSTVRSASSDGFPALMLFDEIDASLHPQLISTLLRVLRQYLIERHGIKIILVTHSPSTVALAPEESLFLLTSEGRKKTIEKATRDEALAVLTAGLPSQSTAYENRRQVIVESSYDALYFSAIYSLVKNDDSELRHISLSFISSGGDNKLEGGCDRVKGLVKGFRTDENKQILGVIDWDKKNNGNKEVRVLAQRSRYSIENCLLDPLPLLVFLLTQDLDLTDIGCTKTLTPQALFKLKPKDIQIVIDRLVSKILAKTPSKKRSQLKYRDGLLFECDSNYLLENGHTLEESLIVPAFPALADKYRKKNAIKNEIAKSTMKYHPETIPSVFPDLFRTLRSVPL